MKKRVNSRTIPHESPIYIEVTLKCGKHHLRIPSSIAGARMLSEVPADLIEVLRGISKAPKDDLLGQVRSAGIPILSLIGHLLSAAWHHKELDLETEREKNETALAHGERVFEELYEAGYSLDEIIQMALIVGAEWITQNGKAAEVVQRADFFGQTKGEMKSSPSTSESTSSETPGASTS